MGALAAVAREFQSSAPPRGGQISFQGGGDSWGIATGEYLEGWSDPQDYIPIIEEMRRSESTLAALETAVSLPLRSVKWWVEPSPDGGEDEAEEFWRQMTHMTISLDDFLRQSLLQIWFGYWPWEIVTEESDPGTLRKFSPIYPGTVERFLTDEDGGLQGIRQVGTNLSGDQFRFQTTDIGVERLLLFTYNQEAGNHAGFSASRRIYRDWKLLDRIYRILIIGLGRSWIGTPVMELAPNRDPEDKDAADTFGKEFQATEQQRVVVRQPDKFDILHGPHNDANIVPIVQHFSRLMLRSMQAQFLALGDQSGSRALSESHGKFFLMQEITLGKALAFTVERHAMEKWYQWNAPEAPRPTIKFGDIRALLEPKEVAEGFNRIYANPAMQARDVDEPFIRDTFDLPEIPEEQLQEMSGSVKPREYQGAISIEQVLDRPDANPDFEKFPIFQWDSGPRPDCPLCASLDGRYFRSDGPELSWMPAHINCDCRPLFLDAATVARTRLEAGSFGQPEEQELILKHGHFIQDPNRYAVLRNPAGPSGRPFDYSRTRARDEFGNPLQDPETGDPLFDSRLSWVEGLTDIPVEVEFDAARRRSVLIPEQDDTERQPNLSELAASLLALDRLPPPLRPGRVSFTATGAAVTFEGSAVGVGVESLKAAVRSTLLTDIAGLDATFAAEVSRRGALLAEHPESFLILREVLAPEQVSLEMVQHWDADPPLTPLGAESAFEDAKDWLAYSYLRRFEGKGGENIDLVPDLEVEGPKADFYREELERRLR